jgi:hypothetical protein
MFDFAPRYASRGAASTGEKACVIIEWMAFPIKTCVVCGEEFELRPGKPGFANRCPECSTAEDAEAPGGASFTAGKADSGLNEARRSAMRDLLYRKES